MYVQASGEAQYTTDIPALPNELAGAFVLTTKGNAKIASVDISKAEVSNMTMICHSPVSIISSAVEFFSSSRNCQALSRCLLLQTSRQEDRTTFDLLDPATFLKRCVQSVYNNYTSV